MWEWQEGPLPDVEDVPDDTRILVFAEYMGSGKYAQTKFNDIFVVYVFSYQWDKRRWSGEDIPSSMHIKYVKYWTVLHGLTVNELTIAGIIR